VSQATSTIPLVFVSNDIVGTGIVKSLAQLGGNATGISLQTNDTANKRFEYLIEALPKIRRLAIMADANFAQTMGELQHVQGLAAKSGIEAIPLEVRRTEDIQVAFRNATAAKADALYVVISELLNSNRPALVASTQAAKLPSVYGTHDWVRAGGLMSYGPNFPALWARTADIIDKILRGSKPGVIPVEQPTRFEFVINAKTAKVIGVDFSETFLARADEVIE
jgi:putative tryptophan/tyrosine transport system substrate-binding protein